MMQGMHLSRESTLRIRKALDNGLPAVFRDSRVVMWPLLRLVLGRHARDFAEFKERAFDLSREEFASFYRRIEGSEVHGPTDLNAACAEAILGEVRGRTVLEVGCGRGWLASRMAEVADHVTASDIIVSDATRSIRGVTFIAADAEALPWPDRSFDVVVSTHTLEHVQDLPPRWLSCGGLQESSWSSWSRRNAPSATRSTRTSISFHIRGRGERSPERCRAHNCRTWVTGSTRSPFTPDRPVHACSA